ncbi:MAG TPA: sodium:solute symporter [Opitutaceae bacterium]|jgi:Na+/proline symporter|nr:sodium:solute symporter [Opitutaceae bacterium]
MNGLDYAILVVTMIAIAAYAVWQTRGRSDLSSYLKGSGDTRWLTIGLSVMATQASAVTFLSTPGQGYESGLGFVQNYFGAPLALIVVAAFFLPIYRRLKVYTAYEYLGLRFDPKTRILGAALFLLQRGLGAGITIYAPAIVLSTVMGWRLDVTIICSGLFVVAYTVAGGCDAVSLTQKYQIGVIFAGMIAAFFVLLSKLPHALTFGDSLSIAGGFHKLEAVDFSLNMDRRYTLWSGVLGGMFLAMAYFGTDQSQVQRYLGGRSLRESRLGLMFNAVFKIPMQFFILLLGVLIFVFYQFERPPVFFNKAAWNYQVAHGEGARLQTLKAGFDSAHDDEKARLQEWMDARHSGNAVAEAAAREAAAAAHGRVEDARSQTKAILKAAGPGSSSNDSDYVFIDFILDYLPHGLIGLLVTAFFAAALSSKAGELNALGSTTTVDIYRHLVKGDASDAHYLVASKCFTAFWGLVAIGFALFANLSENLIQAVNILGSIFYGVVLGMFLVAFFLKRVGGTAVFWSALAAQALVFVLYATLPISYLWYNVIGCVACVIFSLVAQTMIGSVGGKGAEAHP